MRNLWIVGMGLALLGLLAAVPVPAQEQQRGDLGGQLFREDGRTPVANAAMVARHTVTGAVFQDMTDDRGRFLIRNVPVGDYEIRATSEGVTFTYTATVRVSPNALTRICLAQVSPQQALRLLEGTCEFKPYPYKPAGFKPIIIGGAVAAAAGVGIVAALGSGAKGAVTPFSPDGGM